MDADGYCRECETKHGPWGHLPEAESHSCGDEPCDGSVYGRYGEPSGIA